MPFAPRIRFLGLLALAYLAAGCGEELGPEQMRSSHVRGTVRYGDRILVRGWVEFHPFPGTVGNLRVAQIGPDGSFDAPGVAIGRNVIEVVHASSEPQGSGPGVRYRGFLREIPDNAENTLDLDLFEEGLRTQNARSGPG